MRGLQGGCGERGLAEFSKELPPDSCLRYQTLAQTIQNRMSSLCSAWCNTAGHTCLHTNFRGHGHTFPRSLCHGGSLKPVLVGMLCQAQDSSEAVRQGEILSAGSCGQWQWELAPNVARVPTCHACSSSFDCLNYSVTCIACVWSGARGCFCTCSITARGSDNLTSQEAFQEVLQLPPYSAVSQRTYVLLYKKVGTATGCLYSLESCGHQGQCRTQAGIHSKHQAMLNAGCHFLERSASK